MSHWVASLVTEYQYLHTLLDLEWKRLIVILEQDCGFLHALSGKVLMLLRSDILDEVVWQLLVIETKLNERLSDPVDCLIQIFSGNIIL